MLRWLSSVLIVMMTVSAGFAQTPWGTYRGNAQRTGCTDDSNGPENPALLWVHKSKDHFVAAPVPMGERLYVSSLGAFNVPAFWALRTDAKAAKRTAWVKSTPTLKLPTVSSPAVAPGRLIFGDGMHQNNDPILHCVEIDTGFPIWNFPVPGSLVHLEGCPTIVGSKVYIGGGAAGVLCIDADKLTLDGKAMEQEAIKKALHKQWEELLTKYEDEKKKNPDFAVPPSEDQLPKAVPTLLWQKGKTNWHVDAPVTVVGSKVLVASAFLDKEQVGDRSLLALDAETGNVLWKKPLKLNPWGGPSVQGDIVIVSGSSIGYDPAKLKGAKGFIAAYKLSDGTELWHKDIPGGILSCAALSQGAAVVCATDGKVRAFDLNKGERLWIYEAKMPLFAPPAVTKNRVYAGDLKGVLHAIDLDTGAGRWTLDLGDHAETKAPGMIYGGPVVHGGKIYLATCNLEGPFARQETVVVGVGEKK